MSDDQPPEDLTQPTIGQRIGNIALTTLATTALVGGAGAVLGYAGGDYLAGEAANQANSMANAIDSGQAPDISAVKSNLAESGIRVDGPASAADYRAAGEVAKDILPKAGAVAGGTFAAAAGVPAGLILGAVSNIRERNAIDRRIEDRQMQAALAAAKKMQQRSPQSQPPQNRSQPEQAASAARIDDGRTNPNRGLPAPPRKNERA